MLPPLERLPPLPSFVETAPPAVALAVLTVNGIAGLRHPCTRVSRRVCRDRGIDCLPRGKRGSVSGLEEATGGAGCKRNRLDQRAQHGFGNGKSCR